MIGLRFRFERDVSRHFQLSDETKQTDTTDLEAISEKYKRDIWHTLGSNDFLQIEQIQQLTESQSSTVASLRHSTDLILFPFPAGADESQTIENTQGLEYILTDGKSKAFDKVKGNLLVFVRLSISSVLIDWIGNAQQKSEVPSGDSQHAPREPHAGPNPLRNAWYFLQKLISKITKHTQTCRFGPSETPLGFDCNAAATAAAAGTWWHTLSGPDLIGIFSPENATGLAHVHFLIQSLRTSSAEILAHELFEGAPPKLHAFSAVHATLAFRNSDELLKVVREDEFKEQEKLLNISYPSRISTGPGHEQQFLDEIRATVPQYTLNDISWGFRSLQLRFHHLSDVICVIRKLAFGGEAYLPIRRQTISGFRTTVCVGGNYKTPNALIEHEKTKIGPSSELRTFVEDLKNIEKFAKKHLGEVQQQELLNIVNSIRTTLSKNDRATAIRDLIPFFRQLSETLNDDYWKQLPNQNRFAFESLSREFDILFSHCWRAIRNRIEMRGEPLDPMFPNTLENGANKLTNAYSVVSWLCYQILLGDSKAKSDVCGKENFAACVSSGSEGRIHFRELFREIRREANSEKKLDAAQTQSRLASMVLLNISGPTLLRPEIAFAHCLHEVAEFCDWHALDNSGSKLVFSQLRAWLSLFFSNALTKFGEASLSKIEKTQLKMIVTGAVRIAEERTEYLVNDSDIESLFSESLEQFGKVCFELSNPAVCNRDSNEAKTFWGSLDSLSDTGEVFSSVGTDGVVAVGSSLSFLGPDSILDKDTTWVPNFFYRYLHEELLPPIPNDLKVPSLRQKLDSILGFFREVIPDIATIGALKALLTNEPYETIIARYFVSQIEEISKWTPVASGQSVNAQNLVKRWAFSSAVFGNVTEGGQLTEDFKPNKLEQTLNSALTKFSNVKTDEFKMLLPNASQENVYAAFSKNTLLTDSAFELAKLLRVTNLPDQLKFNVPTEDDSPEKSAGTPFRDLLNSFRDTWKAGDVGVATSHPNVDNRRIEFALKLWAKSQVFAVRKMYEVLPNSES